MRLNFTRQNITGFAAFVMLCLFMGGSSCSSDTTNGKQNNVKEDTPFTLYFDYDGGGNVVLSGADVGKSFTIISNVPAPENMTIKLISDQPEVCYFVEDEITLTKGYDRTMGKAIFRSKPLEGSTDGQTIYITFSAEGVDCSGEEIIYELKYKEPAPIVQDDLTLTMESGLFDAEPIAMNGEDLKIQITVRLNKTATRDVVANIVTSRAHPGRYWLKDDQLIINKGSSMAQTTLTVIHNDFIYKTSKASILVELESKNARVEEGCSFTVNAVGTKDITVPSYIMGENVGENILVDLSSGDVTKRVLNVWRIKETNEDMVFLFEIIGAEYGVHYTNDYGTATPVVVVPKGDGTTDLSAVYSPKFLRSGNNGTRKAKARCTVLSGPSRWIMKEGVDVFETNITISKP